MTTKNGSNIVVEWLRSLHLGQYADSFLDNGYDDLEICKQVGDPDLDAIGVFNPSHRNRLLLSVRTLREEGAASVYFTLEESAAIQEECKYAAAKECSSSPSPGHSSGSSTQELQQVHYDEYEEGKAELVRIPKLQLKLLLKDKLLQDGIRLSSQPYTTPVSFVFLSVVLTDPLKFSRFGLFFCSIDCCQLGFYKSSDYNAVSIFYYTYTSIV